MKSIAASNDRSWRGWAVNRHCAHRLQSMSWFEWWNVTTGHVPKHWTRSVMGFGKHDRNLIVNSFRDIVHCGLCRVKYGIDWYLSLSSSSMVSYAVWYMCLTKSSSYHNNDLSSMSVNPLTPLNLFGIPTIILRLETPTSTLSIDKTGVDYGEPYYTSTVMRTKVSWTMTSEEIRPKVCLP